MKSTGFWVPVAVLFLISNTAVAATYEVGPGRTFANIGDVPWAGLQPGDTVLIHWRETPYREKWVICMCTAMF
jgi:hypothetical protein